MSEKHAIAVGPSVAQLVDASGQASPLPLARMGAYRARCTCGWKSQEYGTEKQAKRDGEAHARAAGRFN